MLQEIQQKAVKINNRSDTLRWGHCFGNGYLVLVCGHPKVQSLKDKILFFIISVDNSYINVSVETLHGKIGTRKADSVDSCIKSILSVLKEEFK